MTTSLENIYIIGSGAIGKALAVFLKLADRKVTLIRGSVNDGSSKMEHLQVTIPGGANKEVTIKISTLAAYQKLEGIIVLTSKSYGNGHLAKALKEKIGNSPIVLLQNGLGVEQPFLKEDFPEVYRAVLFVTSQPVNAARIIFKPVSACPIGIIKGNNSMLSVIIRTLHTPDFQFKKESHIQRIIWKKAIINCVFNSVCPLLDTDNGIFHRDRKALEIAKRVIAECIAVAKEKNVFLGRGEVEESLLQISRSSDGQFISTLQDIRTKRRTEIETLNFEVVKIARSLKKEAAVKETMLLGELTKLKAELNYELV
ncbi:ketopantoate reductase family protein [Pontibacter sp. 13R65]|uniref:ketopantoate reductase family protein n=1 Tax=Pontibacter sp. 13R65 TaxID=3127458 RepID=UPI00301C5E3E